MPLTETDKKFIRDELGLLLVRINGLLVETETRISELRNLNTEAPRKLPGDRGNQHSANRVKYQYNREPERGSLKYSNANFHSEPRRSFCSQRVDECSEFTYLPISRC